MRRPATRALASVAAIAAVASLAGACSKKTTTNGGSSSSSSQSSASSMGSSSGGSSSSMTSGSPSSATPSSGGPSLPAADYIKASRDQMQAGGTLRLAIEDLPSNFNEQEIDGNDVSLLPITENIQPVYFVADGKGNLSPDKDYLVSASVISQKPFTTEYKLNPKAVWSDGQPVQFQDFYNDWKANNGKNPAFKIISTNGWEKITNVTQGTDKFDIKVTWSTPYAAWQNQFTELLPSSVSKTPAAFNTAWQKKPTLTAGPFQVSAVDSTAQTVTLTPNPKWWGQKPILSKIIFRSLQQNASVGAFVNGEIDAVTVGTNADILKQAQKAPNSKILRSQGTSWSHFDMNAKSPMLSDVAVRKAITEGLNRKLVAASRLGPVGVPIEALGNRLYLNGQQGYQDNAPAYSTSKAKSDLDTAGWKMNGQYRSKGGKQLAIKYAIPSGSDTSSQLGKLVQNQLGLLGIKVSIVTDPAQTFFTDYIEKGNYDMSGYQWTGGLFPECQQKSIFATGGAQNWAFAQSPKVDQLFDQACATLDTTARTKLGNQIDQQLWQLAAVIPIYQAPAIEGEKNTLANYWDDSQVLPTLDWTNVGFLKK